MAPKIRGFSMERGLVYWICAVLGPLILSARSINFRIAKKKWGFTSLLLSKYLGIFLTSFGWISLARIYGYELNLSSALKIIAVVFVFSVLWGKALSYYASKLSRQEEKR